MLVHFAFFPRVVSKRETAPNENPEYPNFDLFSDPNCADDVGVISCPAPNCPDGSDCTQPTSALTATPDPNDTGNWNTSRPEKQARTEDNDKGITAWIKLYKLVLIKD